MCVHCVCVGAVLRILLTVGEHSRTLDLCTASGGWWEESKESRPQNEAAVTLCLVFYLYVMAHYLSMRVHLCVQLFVEPW